MSPASASSSSSSSSPQTPIWVYSYVKLRFFNRIRRFLRSKTPKKLYVSPPDSNSTTTSPTAAETNIEVIQVEVADADWESTGTNGAAAELQRTVKKLHFGTWEEKEISARAIEKMAKEDVKVKNLMVELRVIPALVSMVESNAVGRPEVALKALLELAKGSFQNKALMVEEGILHKLPSNIQAIDESAKHDFARLLLSLSSLIHTHHFSMALQSKERAIPLLVGILDSTSNCETQKCCIETLYNISTVLENVGPLVSNGAVHTLLKLSSSKGLSDRALAALGNLVVTSLGKKAMESSPMVPNSLIEIMTWEDKPKSVELSAYILMMLAHQSSEQREKMTKSGIVAVLLEVALLGSPLAQKRALKLLQWFKNEKQEKMEAHSGPQTGRIVIGSPANQRDVQEGRKMMKNLVKQSLYKNMELITGRANDGDPAKHKSLVISTSSKSLPF